MHVLGNKLRIQEHDTIVSLRKKRTLRSVLGGHSKSIAVVMLL